MPISLEMPAWAMRNAPREIIEALPVISHLIDAGVIETGNHFTNLSKLTVICCYFGVDPFEPSQQRGFAGCHLALMLNGRVRCMQPMVYRN